MTCTESTRIDGTSKRRNTRAPFTPPTARIGDGGIGSAPATTMGYIAYTLAIGSPAGVLDCRITVSRRTSVSGETRKMRRGVYADPATRNRTDCVEETRSPTRSRAPAADFARTTELSIGRGSVSRISETVYVR